MATLSIQERRATTAALLVVTFLASLDVTVVSVAMPSIIAELQGLSLYGWVFSAYLLTSSASVPVYGKLADRFGRKPMFVVGASLFLIGSLLCGIAPSMWVLVLARLVQGAGAGALIPISLTILGDIYAVHERARVQAVFSLVWGVSSMVGPPLGALLLAYLDWPWVFYVNLPVGLLAMAALLFTFREEVRGEAAPIDWTGAGLLVLGTSALLVWVTSLSALGQAGAVLWPALLVAVLAYAGLFVVEKRAPAPVVPYALMGQRAIAVSTAMGLFIGAYLFGSIAFVPTVVLGVMGKSAFYVGVALIPMSFGWSLGSALSGRVYMRIGYRPSTLIGTSVVCAGAWLLPLALYLDLDWLFFVGVGSTGVGFGFAITSTNVMAHDLTPWRSRGAVTGLLQFARNMGGAVFVAGLGALLFFTVTAALDGAIAADQVSLIVDPERWTDLPAGLRDDAPGALRAGMRVVFLVLAGFASAAWLVTLFLPPVNAGEGEGEQERRAQTAATPTGEP